MSETAPTASSAPAAAQASHLLEHAPCAMVQVEPDGRVCWANAQARNLCPAVQDNCPVALEQLFLPGTPLPVDEAGWAAHAPAQWANAPAWPLRQVAQAQRDPTWVRASAQPLAGGGWLLALQPVQPEQRTSTESAAAAAEHEDSLRLGAQMALAIDLGQVAFWRHDLASNRMHYNAQAFEVLGIPPRPGGMSIDEVRATIHPDDLPQVLASGQQALETGLPVDLDARYRRSDGSWRTVMTRRVLQRDPQGNPVAFVGLALDVTDRVEAQRRSSELAQRIELVTRIAGIGYWSKTLHAERATWSTELRRVFGLRAEEPVPSLQEWLARHVHPGDRERVTASFRRWIKSGAEQVSEEFRVLRADGQVRQVLTQSRLESPGASPLLFGVVIDVTDSRSAAQALREANERVALAARGAGLATWELDVDTGAAYWDEQMWRLRGLQPQADTPDIEGRLATTHPDDRELVARVNQRGMEEDGQIESAFRVVWPDGQVRWLASRSALVRDESRSRLRRIGVNWDITDRRTAEAMRQENELARRESQAKSQFLARMSHELRTPLNAVLGFTQLLQVDAARWARPEALQGQWLGHIQAAGQHLLALINDVLELSSAENSALPLKLQPVSLDSALAEVLALLQPLRQRLGIEVELAPLGAVVLADATRLRQVLLNLLSNALKYNRPGGRVWLRAETLPGGRAALPGQGQPPTATDAVLLSVFDNGLGLSDEQQAHLFEPFNRLGAEALGVEGTGIGLAIVKSLVERMGGQVSAVSAAGQGSCFQVRLHAAPLAAQQPTVSAPSAPPPPPLQATPPVDATSALAATPGAQACHPAPVAVPRHRLLYIEDNAVNALIVSELVARRPDLQLHLASDGLSGVAMAQQHLPELVLLDMQLPDIDGHEVLRRLRAVPATAAIPCVALSANAMPEDIALALNAGMVDYWTKPLDFSVFMQAMDRLFGPAA